MNLTLITTFIAKKTKKRIRQDKVRGMDTNLVSN